MLADDFQSSRAVFTSACATLCCRQKTKAMADEDTSARDFGINPRGCTAMCHHTAALRCSNRRARTKAGARAFVSWVFSRRSQPLETGLSAVFRRNFCWHASASRPRKRTARAGGFSMLYWAAVFFCDRSPRCVFGSVA